MLSFINLKFSRQNKMNQINTKFINHSFIGSKSR